MRGDAGRCNRSRFFRQRVEGSWPQRYRRAWRSAGAASVRRSLAPNANKALIAITLDLEMSRNFPTWDQMHWDYEKGNLDARPSATRSRPPGGSRRMGGVIHFFAVGQTMEQEDVGWLKEIVAQGHPVGNHTYDHVNVKATRAEDIQFRFRRAPWLIEGKTPAEVIAANIRLAESALKQRIGIAPAGFRTPGGFNDGLADRPDLQSMLQKMGYTWVSSKYPAHPHRNRRASHPIARSWRGSSRPRRRPSRLFIRRAWSRCR